jgi:predicted nuclease of restriction endonuclease-like RecB superfamily
MVNVTAKTGRKTVNTYRNKFEKETALFLKKKRVRFKYETERIPYVIAGHYIPDFVVTTPTGRIFIETKGYFRPEDKRKLVAVKKCNPQLDVRLLFYKEVPSQVRWAIKNGFKYAISTVPLDWIKGL